MDILAGTRSVAHRASV